MVGWRGSHGQIQQLFSRAATQIPGRLGGQAPQINGVEIAAGGKHIGPSSGRRSRWSSRNTASGGTADQGASFLVSMPKVQGLCSHTSPLGSCS